MRSPLAIILALIIGTLVIAAPAHAGYAAAYAGQCCYMTLEPGDTATNYFDFTNIGDQIWYRDGAIPVRLGTDGPGGRASAMFDPDDWITSGRPTGLDQATVAPGSVGRFTFVVKAPTTPGRYDESFAPLAEGVVWMAQGCCDLIYTVIPAEPPSVRITAAPSRVATGDAVSVSAEASDNRAVQQVTFALGPNSVTVTDPQPGTSTYQATVPTTGLGSGVQTISATAQDPGGRTATSTSSFELFTLALAVTPPIVTPPVVTTPVVTPPKVTTVPAFAWSLIAGGSRSIRGFALSGVPTSVSTRALCVHGCRRLNASSHKVKHHNNRRKVTFRAMRPTSHTVVELDVAAKAYARGRYICVGFRVSKRRLSAVSRARGTFPATDPAGSVHCKA